MSYNGPTPWLIKQYYYCPIIPWIIVNYGVTEPPTESMRQGKEAALEETGEREVCFRSRKHGLTCRVDQVIGDRKKGYTVVEYKRFKAKSILKYRMQLLAYALIAQEVYGRVRKAVLAMGERRIVYDVTEEALEEAERALRRVGEVLASEKPPPASISRKCWSCWYRRFCPNW